MLSHQNMAKAKTLLSTAASLAASAMLIRSIANDFLPRGIQNYISSSIGSITQRYFSSQLTIVIEEFQGFSVNKLFEAANIYLGTKTTSSVKRLKVGKEDGEKNLTVSMDKNEEAVDVFETIQVAWRLVCTCVRSSSAYRNSPNMGDLNASLRSEVRSYELSFHKKHKDRVLNSYLPYILEKAKGTKEDVKMVKLHTVNYNHWDPNIVVNLNHPMSFKTLAMDSELKKKLLEDLDNFMSGKDYYKRIGKARKRGYLLYGPPGTGKSSLIASMANYLNFDIYDLDLTDVRSNSDLRVLLLSMSNRSILVIEDIDCSVKLQNRESEAEATHEDDNKLTLSGLLNFIDGLWSCCGEERIIVFTTNHKERLDPALLRPGRMDMHIHMSYCTTSTFRQLAFNYLGLSQHPLFEDIERLIDDDKVEVTPAEVAGELMKSTNPEISLQGLLTFILNKKDSNDNDLTLQEKTLSPPRNKYFGRPRRRGGYYVRQ